MSDDKRQKARDEAKVIEEKLANAKLALIHEAYMFVTTNDRQHLQSMHGRREAIEALEYALTHRPANPPRVGRATFG
jgi:hypothetical protein